MTKIEKITHILLIVLCCVSVYVILEKRLAPRRPVTSAAAKQFTGRTVQVQGLAWNSSAWTVILQLSTTCHFCADSMPFYRRLADIRRQPNSIAWVVIGREPAGALQEHLLRERLSVDRVVSGRLEPINFAGTPAIFIVDSQGTVKRAFVGRLSPSDEHEVASIFEKGTV
jgi:hypothetical protein